MAIREIGRPVWEDCVERLGAKPPRSDFRWELVLPSNLYYADRAAVALLRRFHEVEWRRCWDVPIRLAVVECLSNAIEHGNRFQAKKVVRMRVWCNPQRIRIVIRDQGQGFDPSRKRSLEQLNRKFRDRGRGLHIVQHLMDEVKFYLNGREVRLVKKLISADR